RPAYKLKLTSQCAQLIPSLHINTPAPPRPLKLLPRRSYTGLISMTVTPKPVAFFQSEPIRSLDHDALFKRSTAATAGACQAKAPYGKALPIRHPATNRKRTRNRRFNSSNRARTPRQQQYRCHDPRAGLATKGKP